MRDEVARIFSPLYLRATLRVLSRAHKFMAKLRKFEPSDLTQIVKIAKISFPKNRIAAKNFEKFYQAYPDGFLVSEELDEIIGFAVGQFKNQVSQVTFVAVNPPLRQKGIGTELVRSLIEHFKNIGFKELFLHVRTDNKNAIAFFQGLDFRILNTVKKHYNNKYDAFLMGKAI
jgi:ribosomal-protein-alanine N-acetyltransferase